MKCKITSKQAQNQLDNARIDIMHWVIWESKNEMLNWTRKSTGVEKMNLRNSTPWPKCIEFSSENESNAQKYNA